MIVRIGRIQLESPVLLAPMAGITDVPFRDLVGGFGAGLVVSEMVASGEVLAAKPSARARAELGLGNARTSVQLAGREPGPMAEAARYVAGQGARIIDINFGCPAKKVTGGLSGSALMRDPDRALGLVEAVVAAVDVPVTLKMRLGWDEASFNAPEIASRAEAAGVAMITVHGRTRCQFYEGRVDWAAIGRVKRAVRVPVIANGDIVDAPSARAALALSGADGVMIGRGVRGRPWALAAIAAELRGEAPAAPPVGAALAEVVIGHYDAMLGFYGRDLGLRIARKHLGWYLGGAGALRARLMALTDPAAVMRELRAGLADVAPLEAAA
jgi:tRNA-dihydrouridine synthase B